MQTDKKIKLLHSELSYNIIGILFHIHTEIGCGFPEKIYHRAIENELKGNGLTYEKEKEVRVKYQNEIVGSFRLDLIIEDKIILEVKALEYLLKVSKEQLISYLKATKYQVGLLANFGTPKLEYIRMAREHQSES